MHCSTSHWRTQWKPGILSSLLTAHNFTCDNFFYENQFIQPFGNKQSNKTKKTSGKCAFCVVKKIPAHSVRPGSMIFWEKLSLPSPPLCIPCATHHSFVHPFIPSVRTEAPALTGRASRPRPYRVKQPSRSSWAGGLGGHIKLSALLLPHMWGTSPRAWTRVLHLPNWICLRKALNLGLCVLISNMGKLISSKSWDICDK